MKFGERVLQARSKLSLSQIDLAQELGVTNVTISRWENEKSHPTKRQLATFLLFCKKHRLVFDEETIDD